MPCRVRPQAPAMRLPFRAVPARAAAHKPLKAVPLAMAMGAAQERPTLAAAVVAPAVLARMGAPTPDDRSAVRACPITFGLARDLFVR